MWQHLQSLNALPVLPHQATALEDIDVKSGVVLTLLLLQVLVVLVVLVVQVL